MSTHLEFQLDSVDIELNQLFTLTKDSTIFHVAPKLHIMNDPVGTFTLKIKQASNVIATKSLTVAEMNTLILQQIGSVELYKLGYVLFTFDNAINLKRNVEYTLNLSSSGYTFSSSSSLGWVKEYVNETNKLLDTPATDLDKSFSYRLWGFQNA